MTRAVSILIADAQYLIRTGLRHILAAQPSMRITGEAADEEELLEQLRQEAPDVVVLDYYHPGFGLSSIARIRESSPSTHILVISSDNDKEHIYQVMEHGVKSFLTKSCGEEEILDAIRATARGEKFFCTKVIDYLLERSFPKEEESCAPTLLSQREIEIVQLIASGLIAKEIADRLNLSPHTVYTHRKNIMKKLQLSTSSELVLYAVNSGIVEKNGTSRR